jgi:hypothetical protein
MTRAAYLLLISVFSLSISLKALAIESSHDCVNYSKSEEELNKKQISLATTLPNNLKAQGFTTQDWNHRLTLKNDPNTYLTFSFEKELKYNSLGNMKSEDGSLYYKLTEYTNDDWFKLDEKERNRLLCKTTRYDQTNKTNFAPSYLSEVLDFEGNLSSLLYEIKHKQYELDAGKLWNQIQEVTNDFTFSQIHTHSVAYLPIHTPKNPYFLNWLFFSNYYLTLSGLEEGLHPAQLVSFEENFSNYLAKANILNSERKYFSLGFREKNYLNHEEQFLKDKNLFGFELREVSRNKTKFKQHFDHLNQSLINLNWTLLQSKTVKLTEDQLAILDFSSIDTKKTLPQNLLQHPTYQTIDAIVFDSRIKFYLPFLQVEKLKLFNFKTLQYESIPQDVLIRFKNAQSKYITATENLLDEISRYQAQGIVTKKDEIEYVLKWNLTDWAKEARLSEYFENTW